MLAQPTPTCMFWLSDLNLDKNKLNEPNKSVVNTAKLKPIDMRVDFSVDVIIGMYSMTYYMIGICEYKTVSILWNNHM